MYFHRFQDLNANEYHKITMAPKKKVNATEIAKLNERNATLEWIHQHIVDLLYTLPHGEWIQRIREVPLESLPNILFYGPKGFPLEYMAYAFVLGKIPIGSMVQKRFCTWENKLPYFDCGQFLEIQCCHPNMPKQFDELCDFLKHILLSRCIHDVKHIVVIRDIDIIARSSYHYAMRVLLERFSHNVLFIVTTHYLSSIEAPLQSRFMMIRSPQPLAKDIEPWCRKILPNESKELHTSCCKNSDILTTMMNIYKGVKKSQEQTQEQTQENIELSNRISSLSLNTADYLGIEAFLAKSHTFDEIRMFAYRLFQKGISFADLAMSLIDAIKPIKYRSSLLKELAILDHMLSKTGKGREPIYFEKAIWMASYPTYTLKNI